MRLAKGGKLWQGGRACCCRRGVVPASACFVQVRSACLLPEGSRSGSLAAVGNVHVAATQEEYDLSPVPTKVHELIARLEADGWYQVRQKGSHRQFHHASRAGTVTVAGKPGVEVPPGTLNSILKQAGLKK